MRTHPTAIPIVRIRTIKILYPGKSKPNTGHSIFYIEKDIVRDMPRSTNPPKFFFERLVAYYISKLHSSKWLLVPTFICSAIRRYKLSGNKRVFARSEEEINPP